MEEQEDEQPSVTLFGNRIFLARQRKAISMYRRYAKKYRYDENASYPLFLEDNRVIGSLLGVRNVVSGAALEKVSMDRGIVIGTMRMGYRHYRIAMAIASAANSMGLVPYWFDLSAFKTPGARLIARTERLYNVGSRLSQRSKLFDKVIWNLLTGKVYKRIEKNYPLMYSCWLLTDIYKDLPPDIPFVGTHPWPAMAAVHAQMKNVINAIPDNCPLGFHLAPGALHTVQSPSAYLGFRTLKDMGDSGETSKGVPASEITLVGHYVDHELVANVEVDCQARLTRIQTKEARRLLISVGGAGAQQRLFVDLVRDLMPAIQDGQVVLFINFGGHRKVWNFLKRKVDEFEAAAEHHTDWAKTVQFAQSAITENVTGLHTFLNDDAFAAVYTTNLLMRSSDILIAKPSELAYYPIPTLFLRRVGGHEAWGAIRGSELGYGTFECRSAPHTLQCLDMLLQEDDLLTMYCEHIVKLKKMGVYDGAYRVVELAMERKTQV
jgi:hypothetical protein